MYLELSDHVFENLKETEKDVETDLIDSILFIDDVLEDTSNDKFNQISYS